MSQIAYTPIDRPEPLVRAAAMQYAVFARRDPDLMERFLADFGFVRVPFDGATRYFRGHGNSPYLVALRPADEDAFVSLGLAAASKADLATLAEATGGDIVLAEGPGGGRKLVLNDPDGLTVEFVHGIAEVAPIAIEERDRAVNLPGLRSRINNPVRTSPAPSPIARFGHVLMERPDLGHSVEWYMRHFGLLASDVQYLPNGRPGLAFLRFDKGAEPADHHSIAILGSPRADVGHVSFETYDLDALGQGSQHLLANGWEHYWGIGRHRLGSQIFDYFKDPVGNEWEHYIDGDVMDASYPTNYTPLTRGSLWQWGDDLPDTMRPPMTAAEAAEVHAAGGFGPIIAKEHITGLMEALAVPPRAWME